MITSHCMNLWLQVITEVEFYLYGIHARRLYVILLIEQMEGCPMSISRHHDYSTSFIVRVHLVFGCSESHHHRCHHLYHHHHHARFLMPATWGISDEIPFSHSCPLLVFSFNFWNFLVLFWYFEPCGRFKFYSWCDAFWIIPNIGHCKWSYFLYHVIHPYPVPH